VVLRDTPKCYDSLSLLSTLTGTILVILKNPKIKLFTFVISFTTLRDEESEESEICLHIKLSIQNGSNVGLNHGFLRICHSISQKYSNLDSEIHNIQQRCLQPNTQ
jgi:hypothetical protein